MSGQLHLASDADLEALSSVAFTLEPQSPADRRHLLRDEAAFLLDGLLVRVARGHGALDLAIGSGLASLAVGDRLLRLGFSSLGDYARERLGLSGSTAEKLARLARSLADRPLLRAAVRSGAVTPRRPPGRGSTPRRCSTGAAPAACRRSSRPGSSRSIGAGTSSPATTRRRWRRRAARAAPEGVGRLAASPTSPGSTPTGRSCGHGDYGSPGDGSIPDRAGSGGRPDQLDVGPVPVSAR
jgi:hypothetical protein